MARRDPKVLEKLLKIIDREGSPLRRYLLLALYEIVPEIIIKKAASLRGEGKDSELRKAAKFLLACNKMTKEKASSLIVAQVGKLINSLLKRNDIPAITDSEATRLLFELPSEQKTLEILGKLPKIFEANRVLAFRLLQMLNDAKDSYPRLAEEIKHLAKNLSEELPNSSRFLAYLLSEIETLEIEKNEVLLVELAEDKEEFAVARRAAINRLFGVAISDENYARLLKLSSDREINGNLLTLLSSYDINRNTLIEVVLEEMKRSSKHLVWILRDLVHRSFEYESAQTMHT
jgi:hypothetical protein